jgi:hypothetical protein
MTLALSGSMSLAGGYAPLSVAIENTCESAYVGNLPVSMNDPAVRTLGDHPAGTIRMSDFYGQTAIWNTVWAASTNALTGNSVGVTGGPTNKSNTTYPLPDYPAYVIWIPDQSVWILINNYSSVFYYSSDWKFWTSYTLVSSMGSYYWTGNPVYNYTNQTLIFYRNDGTVVNVAFTSNAPSSKTTYTGKPALTLNYGVYAYATISGSLTQTIVFTIYDTSNPGVLYSLDGGVTWTRYGVSVDYPSAGGCWKSIIYTTSNNYSANFKMASWGASTAKIAYSTTPTGGWSTSNFINSTTVANFQMVSNVKNHTDGSYPYADRYVAVDKDRNIWAYSSDGINWYAYPTSLGAPSTAANLAYNSIYNYFSTGQTSDNGFWSISATNFNPSNSTFGNWQFYQNYRTYGSVYSK